MLFLNLKTYLLVLFLKNKSYCANLPFNVLNLRVKWLDSLTDMLSKDLSVLALILLCLSLYPNFIKNILAWHGMFTSQICYPEIIPIYICVYYLYNSGFYHWGKGSVLSWTLCPPHIPCVEESNVSFLVTSECQSVYVVFCKFFWNMKII